MSLKPKDISSIIRNKCKFYKNQHRIPFYNKDLIIRPLATYNNRTPSQNKGLCDAILGLNVNKKLGFRNGRQNMRISRGNIYEFYQNVNDNKNNYRNINVSVLIIIAVFIFFMTQIYNKLK